MIVIKLKFGWFENKNGKVENKTVYNQSSEEIGTYSGEIKDGEVFGQGELILSKSIGKLFAQTGEEDISLEGVFGVSNKLEKGTVIYDCFSADEKIIYQGTFTKINIKREIDGNGVYFYKDVLEFHGDFIFGKPTGIGKQINKRYLNGGVDPVIVEGNFNDGDANGKALLTYANGTLYEGDLAHNGKRHGYGICTYRCGKGKLYDGSPYQYGIDFQGDEGFIYEGEWQRNKRHGKGILKNAKGEVVADGTWENNKLKTGYLTATDVYFLNSKGVKDYHFSYLDNEKIPLGYKGQIENYIACKGKFQFPDGNVYEGDWKNDKFNGKGKLKLADGSIYEGIFKDHQLHGHGKHISINGTTYEGEYKNGSFDGVGKVTSDNGNIYEGFFNNNRMHGKGKFSWANGDIYEGDWKENKKNGEGKMIWANGEFYEGNFVDNVRVGAGRMYWPNGDVYNGEWKNDVRDGQGKFTQPDGSVYDGEWKDGIRNGQGKYISSDGNVYVGDWLDDEMSGFGEMDFVGPYLKEDDLKYAGNWDDGFIHGHGELTRKNGEKLIGTFSLMVFIEGIRLGANGEQIESGFFAMDEYRTCVTSLANNLIEAGEFDEAIEAYTKRLEHPVHDEVREKINYEVEKIKILKKESETKNLLQELRDGSSNSSNNDFDDFE
jgi:hypothetical protein